MGVRPERAHRTQLGNTVVGVCVTILGKTQAPPARSGPPANLTLETVDTSAVAAESAPIVASLTTLYQVSHSHTPQRRNPRAMQTQRANQSQRTMSNVEAGLPIRSRSVDLASVWKLSVLFAVSMSATVLRAWRSTQLTLPPTPSAGVRGSGDGARQEEGVGGQQ
jgi:hypothetical protein